MSYSFGADPELFIRDMEGNLLVACGNIGGTKAAPVPLEEGGPGYAIQEDNVMVEYNIPATTTARRFANSVQFGLEMALQFVRTKFPEAYFSESGEELFPAPLLKHGGARQFGCSPEFNAYEQGGVVQALDPDTLVQPDGSAWRFAGGHVHLGYDTLNYELPKFVVAQWADVFLGLRAVAVDPQPQRRALYGQPGRFRPTSYGIEYRSLSNFWVRDQRHCAIITRASEQLMAFISYTDQDRMMSTFQQVPWNDVRRAIADEDSDLASSLMAYITQDLGLEELQ